MSDVKITKQGNPPPIKAATMYWRGKCPTCGCEFECSKTKGLEGHTPCPMEGCRHPEYEHTKTTVYLKPIDTWYAPIIRAFTRKRGSDLPIPHEGSKR